MYIYHAPINALSPAMVVSSPWVRGEEGRGVSDSVSKGAWAGGRRGGVMVLMYMCVFMCECACGCLRILGMFNVFALIVNQF